MYNPPPIIPKFQYKNCVQINDPVTKKRVYRTPDQEHLPSVTTILSATKDMTSLFKWRKRVGEAVATQITVEASNVGTSMHGNLERFIRQEERKAGKNTVHEISHKMADVIIENGLCNVDEIWALEQSLYFPGLYSGTTDLVGVYKGNPAIMDYKQSNKLKKDEWVEGYRLQIVSYAMAHNEVYGTDIKEGHIFLCTRDLQYQQFDVWPSEFEHFQNLWLDTVSRYYEQNK